MNVDKERPIDSPMMFGMDGYESLAIAIVKNACLDYKRISKKNKKTKYDEWELEKLRKFFLGDVIKKYTTIDGRWLLRKLDSEIEKRAKKDPKGTKVARK